MEQATLLIGGESCPASTQQTFKRHNPISGDVATVAAAAATDDALNAVNAAARAFPDWAAVTPTERRRILIRASEALQARADQFVEAMAGEIGATESWARFNVMLAADMVKSVVDPTVLPNAGLARPLTIRARTGSVLNCAHPAAVDGRVQTCQRVADLILGALAQAVPDRVMACTNSACTVAVFAGTRESGPQEGKLWIYLETIGGGGGARASADGLDGIHESRDDIGRQSRDRPCDRQGASRGRLYAVARRATA